VPDFTPSQKRAMQYWGPVESVVLRGGSTEELWQSINAQAAALGYERAGISATDINWLRQRAVANREAASRLDQLGPQDRITGDRIGQAPWGRPLNEQVALPMWSVRFEHVFLNSNGDEETAWRTSTFTGSVPRTREELELALEEDGQNLANEYEVEHVGIGAYSILAV
jgi:hypothetical protein